MTFRAGLTYVAMLSLLGAAARADDISAEACLSCHGTPGFAGADGRALVIDGAAFDASTHGVLGCTACHTDATDIPHPDHLAKIGFDTCATCHTDAVAAYRHGSHGRANAQQIPEAATCTDCHGNVHRIQSHGEPASAAHWANQAKTCGQCHARIELAEKFRIPVVRPVEAYLQSAHARAVAAGRHGAACGDCHGAHEVLPASDPRSPIARTNVPATCGKCHADILRTYTDSVHGDALAHGHSSAPVCTDCHGEHRILEPGEPTSPVFAANIPRETCGRCHGNERLNEKYGLAGGNVAAFQDSFHGLALRAGQRTVANCASCHGVHDIRPSDDPRSHVNAANLPATCGKCHPGAGTRFALGPVHSTADSVGAWAVSWIRFIYVWLIAGTIGFMTLHNLLDISRKARRPRPAPPAATAAGPERMTRWLRWQHGLVMMSFPILVYTGFALTYPESWWARPLLWWEDGLGVRGALHRGAAAVMLVALAWHGIHLAVSASFRACLRQILPTWRDVIALGQACAYYVGLRALPPHGAKFNYAEKAEYWAFMWGILVMTLTGFLLWFENATLRYFPGWVPDVATAIHFYEAILATLSILVWHFYWVIFDPDVYPMDWTWWDGHPPPTRTRERSEGAGADATIPAPLPPSDTR
jgi:cytochrome b subunit of formate dehydrogenase